MIRCNSAAGDLASFRPRGVGLPMLRQCQKLRFLLHCYDLDCCDLILRPRIDLPGHLIDPILPGSASFHHQATDSSQRSIPKVKSALIPSKRLETLNQRKLTLKPLSPSAGRGSTLPSAYLTLLVPSWLSITSPCPCCPGVPYGCSVPCGVACGVGPVGAACVGVSH